MSMKCEYCRLGGYGDLIRETENWKIYLAPSQMYLGTCVVVLGRNCKDLMDLKKGEWFDFVEIVKRLEFSIKKAFNPPLFNWSCFKNAAYRNHPPDPEIHWHFIPRYQDKIEFCGLVFQDPNFGYVPLPVIRNIPRKVMEKIKEEIKKNL